MNLCPTSHVLICGHQVICNVYFDFPEAHSCWQYSAKKKLVSGFISLIFWKLWIKVPFWFCISASSIFRYRLCIHKFYKHLGRWTPVNLGRGDMVERNSSLCDEQFMSDVIELANRVSICGKTLGSGIFEIQL